MNLVYHWSMYWAQCKDPVSYMYLAGSVAVSWSLTQEVAGLNPPIVMTYIFNKWTQQTQWECIPLGCVPSAAVVVSPRGRVCFSACWDTSPLLGTDPPGADTPPGPGTPLETCGKACWDTTCNACWDSTDPLETCCKACWDTTCKACWDTTPLWTDTHL